MFETIKQNIQKYALLRAAVYIISGIAIVLNPSAVFHFIGYLITAYLVLLGLLNLLRLTVLKGKQVLGVSVCSVVFFPDLSSDRLCFCTCNRFYPADSSWISCYHQQLVPVVLQHEYKS